MNKILILFTIGSWSDGLRDIIRSCYVHYNLDPETYIAKDPEDPRERLTLPEERLQSQPVNPQAFRLMPDQRKRTRSETDRDEDDGVKDDGDIDESGSKEFHPRTSSPIERRRKRAKIYDLFSQDPTPLALRHQKRKKNGQ